MGIYGLGTFIKSHSKFFTNHELYGGNLVIDSQSLAIQLYKTCAKNQLDEKCVAKCNCAFGGDYDKYAHWVNRFFDELDKCNVTPLVLMDGGWENKKISTVSLRLKQRLDFVTDYNPTRQTEKEHLPTMAMLVFKTVLKQREIKVVRCVFEGDASIAGVAKILNCPVLSFDSDFYVFGVKYICLTDLFPFFAKKINGRHVISCKMFEAENLSILYPELHLSTLPVIAVILGNDYIKIFAYKNVVKQFLNKKSWYPNIHKIFKWLENKSLNDAVAAILSALPQNHRRKHLKKIEFIINGYLELSYEMLGPLGFEKNYRYAVRNGLQEQKFSFEGNVDTLEFKRFWPKDEKTTPEDLLMDDGFEEETSEVLNNTDRSSDGFSNTWPSWFSHHYSIANFPAYFVDLMFHRQFIGSVQIENLKYRSAEAMSLKIISVIDSLLIAGREESASDLSCVIRDGLNYKNRFLRTPRDIDTTNFPTLNELRGISMKIRKQIIDDTLGISDYEKIIEKIPDEWRLYVAVISYWWKQKQSVTLPRSFSHVYALLFTMLMGVIDRKIGFHRSFKGFDKAYSEEKSTRNSEKTEVVHVLSDSIIEAVDAVTKRDCLVAARFFISNYEMDMKLQLNPIELFDIRVVHWFSQFQSCVKHADSLNALLGCPYKSPIVAELFNGTMLYNLYNNFAKQPDVEAYIDMTLKESPSLLQLLKLLITEVKRLIVDVDNSSNDYDECLVDQDEILHVLTPKARKIFESEFVDDNRGRGVTKRKNKKKKKKENLFDEYSATEEEALREELTKRRRRPKKQFLL